MTPPYLQGILCIEIQHMQRLRLGVVRVEQCLWASAVLELDRFQNDIVGVWTLDLEEPVDSGAGINFILIFCLTQFAVVCSPSVACHMEPLLLHVLFSLEPSP